ncbi:MAG: T9SS type A sorting domain-containing protein, partial [Bacteroidales bacterium]|nr:T9SS type A sorting domain-containing protein [Bacteroidales bacterium]
GRREQLEGKGASVSYDGGHTWTTMPGTEGSNFRNMTWLNNHCGWAGGYNVNDSVGGVFKFIGDFSSQTCLPEGIIFTTQAQIDNFQTNHPNCTEIEGSVTIHGNDITNLFGLNVLTSMEGGLGIGWYSGQSNPLLTSLSGLDNLTYIGGLWFSSNSALIDITSLANISSIGGELSVGGSYELASLTGLDNVASIEGDLVIHWNFELTSLSPLNNVSSIAGKISILHNDELTSLEGLSNINAESIDDLFIYENNSLMTCEVQSICDYLVSPNGTIEIYDNATGCNSKEEVEDACEITSMDEVTISDILSISPNPFNYKTTIEFYIPEKSFVNLSISDMTGKLNELIISEKLTLGKHHIEWIAEGIPAGIYFIRLETNGITETKKIVLLD